MGVGGLGHLAETEIEPLREEDVQESDPVLAWRARAQVRESVGEAGGGVHLQQHIGDPHLGQATIEVEHELIDVLRHCGGGPADPEFAILDGAAGYPAVVRGIGETIQAIDQAHLVFGQPLPRFKGNRQPGRCVGCFHRHQGAFYIAIASGVRQPDVAGAESVAHMKKGGDFPKPAITGRASVEMLMPPRIAAQEGTRHVAGPGSDSSQRGKDRFASAGSLDLQRAQHAWRIAPEPGPALNDVSQRIGRRRVAQLISRSDNALEPLPTAGSRDGLFKRRAVHFCLEKRRSKGPEGVQSIVQYCPRILNTRIATPLRTSEGLADDPVMGLDHGIGDGAAPLHGADGTDGETAITRNVAQPVSEVALPLAAKTRNAMGRNGLQQIGGKLEAPQEFQAIEKAVDVSRVPAHLEPAQPDEPAHAAVDFLGKQLIETHAHGTVQARGDTRLYPALCGNQCVRAKTLQDR